MERSFYEAHVYDNYSRVTNGRLNWSKFTLPNSWGKVIVDFSKV